MQALQVFLNVRRIGQNNDWNKLLTTALQKTTAIETVQIIENNEKPDAEITLTYHSEKLSFNDIEEIIFDSGANITAAYLHIPSSVTGIGSPYSESALATSAVKDLHKIQGLIKTAISSTGELKVELDPGREDKEAAIKEILNVISSFHSDERPEAK